MGIGPRLGSLTAVLCLLCAAPINGPRQQPGGNKCPRCRSKRPEPTEEDSQPGNGQTHTDRDGGVFIDQ